MPESFGFAPLTRGASLNGLFPCRLSPSGKAERDKWRPLRGGAPLPIPNREVKPRRGDDTAGDRGKVARRPPTTGTLPERPGRVFCFREVLHPVLPMPFLRHSAEIFPDIFPCFRIIPTFASAMNGSLTRKQQDKRTVKGHQDIIEQAFRQTTSLREFASFYGKVHKLFGLMLTLKRGQNHLTCVQVRQIPRRVGNGWVHAFSVGCR